MKTTVTVTKLTGEDLLRAACASTTGVPSNISLKSMYKCQHSPIRTQLFWVEMLDVPYFVSVHFARHNVGVTHFVQSNREDRGGKGPDAPRNTPVKHSMLINAEALINMSRKRLCNKAHGLTKACMLLIRQEVRKVDQELAKVMCSECVYRGGKCHELTPCKEGPKCLNVMDAE